METIQPGVYRHYKGNLYEVLGTALHSETEEEMVVYRMLYETEKYPYGTLWVRPKALFLEKVAVEGRSVSRFAYVH